MNYDVSNEWRNFESALIEELNATPINEFESAWPTGRTQFYGTILLPRIAARLGYELQYEFILCDYVLLNKENHAPMVFVESENSCPTASREIYTLCTRSSPVKVLFLCCEWFDSERSKYLPGWMEKIATHHKYCDLNAVYMIVVGEWGRGKPNDDGILRYYIESYDICGKEISRHELVLQ